MRAAASRAGRRRRQEARREKDIAAGLADSSVAVAALAGCVTAGCSGGQSDLQKWIAETKKKPGGRIQPLPEVKPYESFVYSASNLRSPFQPASPNLANGAGVRPSVRRNREFLEGFSLDTLKMVGTFKVGEQFLRTRAIEGRPGAQGSARQLHRAERREGD